MILLRFRKLTIWVLVAVVTLNGSQDLFAQTAAPRPVHFTIVTNRRRDGPADAEISQHPGDGTKTCVG